MERRLKTYLAGPEVFLPNAIEIGLRKKQLCADFGFEGLFPFDNEISLTDHKTRIDRLIYRANVAMMPRGRFRNCQSHSISRAECGRWHRI